VILEAGYWMFSGQLCHTPILLRRRAYRVLRSPAEGGEVRNQRRFDGQRLLKEGNSLMARNISYRTIVARRHLQCASMNRPPEAGIGEVGLGSDMGNQNPLTSIFSEAEIARLGQGKCLVSNRAADDSVSYILTDEFHRDFQLALAAWFALAEEKCCGDHFRQRLRTTVNNRASFLQVVGELTAGHFLYENVDSKVEYRCADGGADFKCPLKGTPLYCEVKTLVGGNPPGRYMGPGRPATRRLQQGISACRKQLDRAHSNLVLMVDWWWPGIRWENLVDALYGSLVVTIPMNASGPIGKEQWVRLRDGKCGPKQMTRIGAVGVLRSRGDRTHAWFVHNPFAQNPIVPELLDPWSQLVPTEKRGLLQWRNGTPHERRPVRKT